MKSVFQEWLAAEFAVAEAERRFRLELLQYDYGERRMPPEVASLLRARVVRHEARAFLERVIPAVSLD
ncbi:hypothetical protein [Ramlibacter albus]|uniref:Uncharacterized protein n=1 Tax=Ramlibacter albus TaxID=2079448 RepID=A0A923M8S4_9BURK|nr:hypothetical protein [Ramlibacter albus]MBC5764966.1 hypothetical protein [Ramlibacter albus]